MVLSVSVLALTELFHLTWSLLVFVFVFLFVFVFVFVWHGPFMSVTFHVALSGLGPHVGQPWRTTCFQWWAFYSYFERKIHTKVLYFNIITFNITIDNINSISIDSIIILQSKWYSPQYPWACQSRSLFHAPGFPNKVSAQPSAKGSNQSNLTTCQI